MSISAANRAWKEEAARRRERTEQSRNLPSRFQGGTSDLMFIYITGGNELDTTQDGIEYADEEVDALDADYDAETDDSFQSGIGVGDLYKNGENLGPVLVLNDPRSLVGDALLGENGDVERDRVMVIGTVTLQTPSDGPRTVYLVA